MHARHARFARRALQRRSGLARVPPPLLGTRYPSACSAAAEAHLVNAAEVPPAVSLGLCPPCPLCPHVRRRRLAANPAAKGTLAHARRRSARAANARATGTAQHTNTPSRRPSPAVLWQGCRATLSGLARGTTGSWAASARRHPGCRARVIASLQGPGAPRRPLAQAGPRRRCRCRCCCCCCRCLSS
jgi:hypothetical protein